MGANSGGGRVGVNDSDTVAVEIVVEVVIAIGMAVVKRTAVMRVTGGPDMFKCDHFNLSFLRYQRSRLYK